MQGLSHVHSHALASVTSSANKHRMAHSTPCSRAPAVTHSDTYHGPISGSAVGGHDNVNVFNPPKTPTVFALLHPHIAAEALYNSREREKEHASTCLPETRTKILQRIRQWVDGEGHSICWMHGPAGTGKSTIAHTIAEEYSDKGLAATFFFARDKGGRDDFSKLIPTLAYQIAQNISSTEQMIQEVLEKDGTILHKTLRDQFSALIIGPMTKVKRAKKSLVVLDGLDECASRDDILKLIWLLGEKIEASGHSIRLLLTSRPEPNIEVAFRLYITSSTALWLALEDSKEDVRKYLRESLLKVREKFSSVMQNEPRLWPGESVLDDFVAKSEGLFLHATTAVEYIGDGKGLPQKKLQAVLNMHKGLDALYTQVIGDAQESEQFDIVMGSLMYLREQLTISKLAHLLELDVGEIRVALDGCHSILVVPEDDDDTVRPYHASLRDFLTSHERSQDLFCAPSECHGMLLIQCLKTITSACAKNDRPLEYACTAWVHHGSLMLSDRNASQLDRSLLHCAEAELEQIDLTWVECWMAEALVWVKPDQLRVNLPLMGIPEAYQAIFIATQINMIVNAVS